MTATPPRTTSLRKLGRDTLIYGTGNMVQAAIAFLLCPLYTRLLTREQFGTQDLIISVSTVLTYMLVMGLDAAAGRFYFDSDLPRHREAVLSTWLSVEVFLSLPVVLVIIVWARPICQLIFGHAGFAGILRLAVAAVPIALVNRVVMLSLRLDFRSARFSLMAITGVLAQAVAAVLFVVMLHLSLVGVFLSIICANVAQLFLGVWSARSFIRIRIDRDRLTTMLRYGLPLVPASLSLWILNYSNFYFLNHLAKLGDIAVLGVGTRLGGVVGLIVSAFLTSWAVFAYSIKDDLAAARELYSRTLTYFLVITLTVAVVVCVFGREVVSVLTTSVYKDAASLLPAICFSIILWGVVDIVGIGFSLARKSYHATVAAILGAVVTTSLNIWLIPKAGVRGAVVAILLGNLVIAGYSFFSGQRYFPVRYQYRPIVLLVGASIAAMAVAIMLDRGHQLWTPTMLFDKAFLVLSYFVVLMACGVVRRTEINKGIWYVKTYISSKRGAAQDNSLGCGEPARRSGRKDGGS